MTSGQIQTKATLDYEVQPTYSVTVIVADSGHGGGATVPVTITVTDVEEQPETPAAPTVTAVSNTSLEVSWTAPDRNGGPLPIGYKLRYGKVGSESWTETSTTQTLGVLKMTFTSLDPHTAYQAQVQALNGRDAQPLVALRDRQHGEQPAGVQRYPAGDAQRGGEHGCGGERGRARRGHRRPIPATR